MEYVKLLLFGLAILGEALFFIQLIKIPKHLAVFFTILANTLFLYIFALLNWLTAGFYACLIIAVVLSIFAFRKPKNALKEISFPLLAFLVVFLLSFLYTRGTLFYEWDEFSHWGLMFKYLMTAQELPEDLSTVIVSYPPFSALWQYLAASAIGFKEENAYFAQLLIQFSAIIALFPYKKTTNWKKTCLFGLAAVLSVYLFDLRFQSLYMDLCMGLVFAAGLAQIKFEGSYSLAEFLSVVVTASALVLLKPIGIVFALILIVLHLFAIVFLKIKADNKQFSFSYLCRILFTQRSVFLLIVPLLFWFSWSQYTRDFDPNQINFQLEGTAVSSKEIFPWIQEEYITDLQQKCSAENRKRLIGEPVLTTIGIPDLFRAFTFSAPYSTKMTAGNFVQALSEGTYASNRMSPKVALVAIVLMILFNSYLLNQTKHLSKKIYLYGNGILCLGCVLYLVGLYLSYVFIFGCEGFYAPSLTRYLASYLLAWWCFNIAVTFMVSTDSEYKMKVPFELWGMGMLVLAGFLILPVTSYLHLPESPAPERFIVYDAYKTLSQVTFTRQDKVYEVYSNNDAGVNHFYMRYYLAPVSSNYRGWSIGTEPDISNDTLIEFSPSEWLSLLNSQGYTYVLVSQADQQFWNGYGELFDSYLADTSEPQLFKVTENGLHFIALDYDQ